MDFLNQTSFVITESLRNAFTLPNIPQAILPLLLYTSAIVLYAILVWHFHKFIAARDILTLDLDKYNTSPHPTLAKVAEASIYLAKFFVIFPLVTFFSFVGFAIMMFFMSQNADTGTILLTSITLISAIRATAYYSEDLSKDLAKLLPLTLLAVFLLDPSFFSLDLVINRVMQLPYLIPIFATYLSFTVILEVILKLFHFVFNRLAPPSEKDI